MAWNDRLKGAIYTSPSGEIFVFDFENVSKTISKKTTAFDFPDVEGTYIQDLGKRGRRYPFRVIFWGEDYDIEAERFDNALEEKGAGTLQHPFYPGVLNVVPVGDISRNDNLKTAANQAVYNIEFWETIEIVFPISELSASNQINQSIEDFEIDASENFADGVSLETGGEISGLIQAGKTAINKVKTALAQIAATVDSIEQQFNDAFDLINDSIDTLIGTPALLARQLINITRIPSQATATISQRLEGYTSLLNSFVSGDSNNFEPSNLDNQPVNEFTLNNLMASSAIIAAIESTISDSADFQTRSQVIAAIESLQTDFDNYVLWADENRNTLLSGDILLEPGASLTDTGEGYQQLLAALNVASGRLTEIAFTALQERSIILDRNRSLIDFEAEYYGTVDENTDFIIDSNNLSGAEILTLPRGRKMLYYV